MRRMKARVELLSENEIVQIHENSLRILERMGMRVPNITVCRLAGALGAIVDESTMTVRLPGKMMEELLDTVRKTADREKQQTGSVSQLTGNVSTQIFMADYKSGTRRYGTMEDVLDGIALIQSLDRIPHANAVVVPSDVPEAVSDVLCYRNIYKYSQKDGGTYILTPGSARYIIEMSRIMGRKVSYLFDTISPLSFSENSLDIALIFREHELELTMTPMVMGGATGPISIAGLLTLQNAEVLGSLFFIYAITGRIPKYVAAGHTNDIRRNMMCSFGSPNQALIGVGIAQMADFYGLKSGSNSGLTDSVYPDFQCGFEKTLSAAFSMLAGTEAIGGQGLIGADQGMSFAQLVLDNEWIDAFNYVTEGIEVNEDSIGYDTIEEVGIGGNYICEEHTIEYMRESSWNSELFERDSYDNMISGGKDLLERADEKARELIAKNRTDIPVVAPEIARALDDIADQAVKELT
ncbi:trimethylamine methyltransferase family protein [Ruminococcus gauvreauii]|uniref:Trimethylamine methyltransferase family protein n=1 Tax=Ruminococcus gauvreauii TaxID=438033 RepID=A0ABY5VD76_9FIRM|nr:trimethylamine methyltransferase family protein [Ruminococcus gauvreauii]UWP57893.1 trimethylamine methyltransferase family protein [Ruminococcus gauvreauii]